MVDLWVEFLSLAVLIGLSGFFSGLEVALVGTRSSKVRQLLKDGTKGAAALHRLKSNPGWMMSSVNLGNNLVNVGSAALATSIALRTFGDDGLGIAVGVMTFLILVFGEITPKTYCNANAVAISLRFAPVLIAFGYALWPVVKVFEYITRGMVKLTGSSYYAPPITEDEIRGVVEQGLADKAIEEEEGELVHGALGFDDTIIRAVMTPRTRMFTLNAKMLLFEALPLINQRGHSRIPILGEGGNEIVGFVHAGDILKELEHDKRVVTLEQIARKPVFVSQEKRVSSLLKEMQGRKVHMAMVIDEHGGIVGLVTLEDLLEEIVGEIEDETDKTRPQEYHSIDRDTIITSGDIEINRINEIFKADVPEGEDYASLSGLLHERLHDIPQEGDKVEVGSLRIIVEEVKKNVPKKVRIERIRRA
ncbi:hemolysin [Cenarchaeum symbiosum A]|uniref:Hemolysin n=1 Tax=Cenarchaeum symbiosum (strain A) TaxID=414004 RepID=A0RW86_CENSY|nr:hemolysin [Cenarchaeum symbiosum A]